MLIRKLPIQLFTILTHYDVRSLISIAIYDEHINFKLNKNPDKNLNLNQHSKSHIFNKLDQTQYRPSYPQPN